MFRGQLSYVYNNGSHQLTPHGKNGRSQQEDRTRVCELSDSRGGKSTDMLLLLTRHHPYIRRRLVVYHRLGLVLRPVLTGIRIIDMNKSSLFDESIRGKL
jgi:hypothetical protein